MQGSSFLVATALQNLVLTLVLSEIRSIKSFGTGCDSDQIPRSDGLHRTIVHMNVKFWCVSESIFEHASNTFLQTTQTHQVSVENLPDVNVFIKHPTIDLD
ncbi:hypothetical protein C8R48DRAFT_343314 [Suillus tomentosus]|jgi:hypothetical protein|nr:hypothetical protein C8R48DRAFT_343314 [Suillus tomentosus]